MPTNDPEITSIPPRQVIPPQQGTGQHSERPKRLASKLLAPKPLTPKPLTPKPLTGAQLIAGALLSIGLTFATSGFAAQESGPQSAKTGTSSKQMVETPSYLQRPAEDEIIYFMLPDRFENGDKTNDKGGMTGGALTHGFDPTHTGFYHGGDLKGLTARLDYIKGLGATAIWLGPIYKNKPVQGGVGKESAGYHGYWVTDFTSVDPHLGTKADMKAFVDGAHKRGMKVYLDIITNHTADVISYRECYDESYQGVDKVEKGCPYRHLADYPYTTRGGIDGQPINDGFLGDEKHLQSAKNFQKLTRPDYAYTPFIPDGEENAKTPQWLNNIEYYHNRGETTFEGESSLYGDFAGLDDLMTEHPVVVAGFIDIFKDWVFEYRIDGFRIDTTRHVNSNFWQQFLPAIKDHATSLGITDFYMFGEVYDPDPAGLARFTRIDGFDQVLDFGFQSAVLDVISGQTGTDRFDRFLKADALYGAKTKQGRRLPTFLGTHDMGRLSGMIKTAMADITQSELLARTKLAHGLMMFMRGVPVIYSGDEQGFVSDGHDQGARESLFPSQVASYNDNDLIGTAATTAQSNFDTDHPLYRYIAKTAALRTGHSAFRRGEMVSRLTEKNGAVFAFSRFDPDTGHEYIIAANTGTKPRTVNISVDAGSRAFTALLGKCPSAAKVTGTLTLALPELSLTICKANARSTRPIQPQ